jgi:hypothetical protein
MSKTVLYMSMSLDGVTHDALVSFQQSAVGVLPASAQRAWDSTR